jgi:subtilisin family serine protease
MLHSSRSERRRLESQRHRNKVLAVRQLMVERLEQRTVLAGSVAAAYAPHELLMQFKPSVSEAARTQALAAVQGTIVESLQRMPGGGANPYGVQRVNLPSAASVDAAISALKQNPNVRYAEPNWNYRASAVSNDPIYTSSQMWGTYSDDSPTVIGPSGTTNQYGSQAEEAWNPGYTGDRDVVVGVIDEGIYFDHPDLANNIWTNPFDPVDGIDNDGNGYVDDIHGWDFFNDDNSVYDGTGDDHGTHVAGTIGAQGGNATGVVGINWKTTMISAKFLGPSGGFTSDAVSALDYFADLKTRHGINIVATNNSWGGGGFSQALLDAITNTANEEILFIAAAGNAGSNNDAVNNYPSNYNTTAGAGYDAVIAVASIASNGLKASDTSYGLTTVDLGAPGVSIASTYPAGVFGTPYAFASGTSMATPHVTGAAALYATYQPSATADQIRSAILGSVTSTSSLNGFTATGGRLNISALMQGVTGPTFSIDDVSISEGNSGTSTATFTVTLSASFGNQVTVNYATANGSATAGSDYVSSSGTLTFAPGVESQTISITINGDTNVEANETFVINLSTATGGASIADAQAQGTIQNDDVQPPTLSSVVINSGVNFTNNAQRSQITTLQVTFSGPVTLDAGAFTLQNIGLYSASSSFIPTGQILYTPGTAQSFVITFGAGGGANGSTLNGVVKRAGGAAASTTGNSLADGNYKLTIDPSKVHQSDGQMLSGNNVFGAAQAEKFFRMFGDSDGDGDVDGTDTVRFRAAQTAYNAALDWNGNGSVTVNAADPNSDSNKFSANNGKKRRTNY